MNEVLDWVFAGAWYEMYLRIYGLVAFSHIVFEYILADAWRRKSNKAFNKAVLEERHDTSKRLHEPIAALVPAFQEDMKALKLCLEGLNNQLYEGPLLAVVVDDGSYLKDIERFRTLAQHPSPPKPLALWKRIALRLFKRLRRYSRFQVKVVDYQAKYQELLERRQKILDLCEEYATSYPKRFKFIAAPRNQGKRRAHKLAHDWVKENFDAWVREHHRGWLRSWQRSKGVSLHSLVTPFGYMTVDSDTWTDPHATLNLVRVLVNDESVGAATGYVEIGNHDVNWLTHMVDWRYWSAFFVERAAQSRFGSVMCCSGPLSMYRGSILDDEQLGLIDLYVTQTFLGVLCTFGDDRRMTYLILRSGFKVIFAPFAKCLTYAPTTWDDYERQQTRWNMSFYRELILSMREIFVWNVYMTYEMLMQLLLPFALLGGIIITIWLSVFEHKYQLAILYVVTVVGIGLFRSAYGAIRRREWSYLLFSLYGFMYIRLIIVRFRAIGKLLVQRDTTWQTRGVT